MSDKQLRMDCIDLSFLPNLHMPDGYTLRTYQPGDEAAWASIMNTGIGEWTAELCRKELTSKPQFLSDGLFFAISDGVPIGSACAWRMTENDVKDGCLHMVCVLPEHRGNRLGYLLTLAVMHYFRDNGYEKISLTTDDWRIAAIKTYLRLGFKPYYYDDSHIKRWNAIFEKINAQSE